MKKKEAIELVKNTKVYVKGKSKEVQEKLFQLGFEWLNFEGFKGPKIVQNTEAFFLYIGEDLRIVYGENMNEFFNTPPYKEILAEEILNIQLDDDNPHPKYEFKPFDKVLVRKDDNDTYWHIELFSSYDEGWYYPYICLTDRYSQCIPYEGNEELLGTNKQPMI